MEISSKMDQFWFGYIGVFILVSSCILAWNEARLTKTLGLPMKSRASQYATPLVMATFYFIAAFKWSRYGGYFVAVSIPMYIGFVHGYIKRCRVTAS